MPNREAHEAAAIENENALIFLLTRPNDFPQWVTTIAFYTAVHAIEALFATTGTHSDDHSARNQRLKTTKKYQHIWRHFRPLWNDSQIARYLTSNGHQYPSFSAYLSPDEVYNIHVKANLGQIVQSIRRLMDEPDFLSEVDHLLYPTNT